MRRPVAVLAALVTFLPMAASAQEPQRIRNVQLTGDAQCPKAAGDEIVVCSRISPNEQYRIPKELRNTDRKSVV